MRTQRAAVIGTGFIGPVHVEGLRRAGVEVAALIGSTPEKSRAAAERWGIATRHSTFDEVLADSTIDAVHITTPNRWHYSQTLAVLNAGKHVLCEKPLAMNTAEAAELARCAARSGRVTGVAYNIRFYPLCHEAAQRVRSAEFGELLHVQGSYVQDWLLRETDFNWRVLAEAGGELRAVADIGTHWLDLTQFVTGRRVVALCADLRTVHATRHRPLGNSETFAGRSDERLGTALVPIDTEDCGAVLLRFDNGANGCLWVSQTTAGRKNCLRFEIAGQGAALAWNSESPNELWIGHRERPNELLLRDPALLAAPAASLCHYPGGHNEGFPDTFKQLFRQFYDYIDAGDYSAPAPFPTFAEGYQEVALCEAILRSHRERRWVEIDELTLSGNS